MDRSNDSLAFAELNTSCQHETINIMALCLFIAATVARNSNLTSFINSTKAFILL